jgi:hypothetical protein
LRPPLRAHGGIHARRVCGQGEQARETRAPRSRPPQRPPVSTCGAYRGDSLCLLPRRRPGTHAVPGGL